jgi:hypothetical protein
MNVREEVIDSLRQVAKDQHRVLASLDDNVELIDTGLDSLTFALTVIRLECVLGVDPFSGDDFADFPLTMGDLIRRYETAVGFPVSQQALPSAGHLPIFDQSALSTKHS